MLKNIITILIVSVMLIWNTFASNYELTNKDRLIVNKLNNKIKPLLKKQTLAFREKLENKINELQVKYKSNKSLYYILEKVKYDNYMFDNELEYTNHYKNYNIDFKKVKSEWLKRHNNVRKDLWVTLYSYDERLDNTAYEWSRKQWRDWVMSHKKYWSTEYYNYTVVEQWFQDRWVKCVPKGWATSSESIWKFWYYCKDWECTDDFLKSLKVIFDIYMAEKWTSNDAHYRWITLWSLTKIWLWLSIYNTDELNYNEYFMTTHYCTEFKK